MKKIVVLCFEDDASADAFSIKLDELTERNLLEIDDEVKVSVDENGKAKVHHEYSLAAGGAVFGGFMGAIVGLLFLAPLPGAVLGAAGGAAIGELEGPYGIDKDFIRKTTKMLTPGTVALFLMIEHLEFDKLVAQLESTHAGVVETTLSSDAEAKLRAAFAKGDAVD